MTTKELVSKIKREINLAEFCNSYYGTSFNLNMHIPETLCIFHKEDTPSLKYNKDSNTIKCWAKCYCDKVGSENIEKPLDIFMVVGLKEGLEIKGEDFVKILKFICERVGIPFDIEKKKVNHKIEQILEHKTKLALSYVQNLKDNDTHMVHTYLRNDRGLTAQTIADFHLGITNENEAKFGRPFMSNRLSIPILNDSGDKVIAISARHLVGYDGGRKYTHDSVDEVWERGKVLYGYSHAKDHVKKANHVYVVEGYFDLMSLYQAGIKNVVAVMSNTISEYQIKKIKTLTNNATILLDQDNAGLTGFKATLELMLRNGLNVKVIPNLKFKGKDANDLCINFNWDSLKIKSFLTSCSRDAIQYILSETFDKFDSAVLTAKYEVLKVSSLLVDLIQDPIKKLNYEQYISKRLNV